MDGAPPRWRSDRRRAPPLGDVASPDGRTAYFFLVPMLIFQTGSAKTFNITMRREWFVRAESPRPAGPPVPPGGTLHPVPWRARENSERARDAVAFECTHHSQPTTRSAHPVSGSNSVASRSTAFDGGSATSYQKLK